MAALFGKKPGDEKTVLVLDVENGSAAAALVRLSPTHPPKLFGEVRTHAPLFLTHDAGLLAREIEKRAKSALLHVSEVAARLRNHSTLSHTGMTERSMVFLHAPWSSIRFEESGQPTPAAVEHFLHSLRTLHSSIAGDIPISFHSFAASASPLIPPIYNVDDNSLICSVSSEVAELLLLEGGRVCGYATIPFGTRTLVRTLRAHAGLSEEEVRSLLALSTHPAKEALDAASLQFSLEVGDTVRELLRHNNARHVFVVANEPFGACFAEALTHKDLGEVFRSGGVVRVVKTRHVTPYLALHAQKPDLSLMLASLFADAKMSGI